ncbi:hypothetical protein TNCV_4340921 [Trichonephila clavipes]|nr:hypothetical protein TNCV_4340921 [Trichonephila clavipes]
MDMYNKVLLYTAVLRPIISYGCPVWGYAAKTNINILEVAQNSIIRTITKANSQLRGNSLSSTDQPQCLLSTPAHSKLPWFPPQTFTSSPLLRLATTSVSTIFQPANQVAPCSPFRTIPLPQATFTIQLWDGGTLRVPCPNISYTVIHRMHTRKSLAGDSSSICCLLYHPLARQRAAILDFM